MIAAPLFISIFTVASAQLASIGSWVIAERRLGCLGYLFAALSGCLGCVDHEYFTIRVWCIIRTLTGQIAHISTLDTAEKFPVGIFP